jgi:polyhydroxybutyrate depolymerase
VNLPGLVVVAEAVGFRQRHRPTATIDVDGLARNYVVHVPAQVTQPAALVISLHGGALWGAAQRDLSGWNAVADREGFVVVYPSGVGRWSPSAWRSFSPGRGMMEDVAFIGRVIDTMIARHGVDPRRVFVNGLSNGGAMAFALSCEMPDRIAAVGIVGGALALDWKHCRRTDPMPVVVIHGTEDQHVPLEGGTTWIGPFVWPNLDAWVARFAQRNRCGQARDSVVGLLRVREFDGCAAVTRYYLAEGTGHVWPGGKAMPRWFAGPDTGAVDASELLWNFYRER